MNRILVFSLLVLLYSGCSNNQNNVNVPVIDDTQTANNDTDGSTVAGDIVSVSDNNIENAGGFDDTILEESILDIKDRTQNIYFDVDQYSIKESEKVKIVFNTKLLAASDLVNRNVVLEGNCDEWGSDEYNYALGLKRARTVKRSLIVQGIDKSRLSIISYGESNFVCNDKTKDCWAKNRRVEFNIK